MKEESDVASLTEKERELQMTGLIYLKNLSPRVLLHTLGTWKSEYLRLNEENEKENRGEATRRGREELYQR